MEDSISCYFCDDKNLSSSTPQRFFFAVFDGHAVIFYILLVFYDPLVGRSMF